MMEKGYEQAIQNLAYYIIAYADRDFKDIPVNPFGEPPTDLIMETIKLDPDMEKDWITLEEAATLVTTEYNVKYEDLMADVWVAMIKMDTETGKYIN